MNRCKVNMTVLLILSLVLTACSTVPKPRSSDSTLLIVKSTRQLARTEKLGLGFWLYMEDGTRHRVDFSRPENITFIKDLGPGTVRSRMLRVSLEHGTTSSPGVFFFDYPLRMEATIKPGSYAVFPAVITYREVMTLAYHFEFTIDFKKVDSTEMREILNRLEAMGISDRWARAD